MNSIYSDLLHSLRTYLEAHPFSEFKRGDLKKLLTNNAKEIKDASMIYTQKTIVERLSSDLNIDLNYQYVNHVLKSLDSSSGSSTLAKPFETKQTDETRHKQQVKTKEDKRKDPILDEDKTDSLGRKPYPVDNEITPEKMAEWKHLNLPNFAVRKLISFRISVEEWKALDYTIRSSSAINEFVTKHCQELESKWLKDQYNQNK